MSPEKNRHSPSQNRTPSTSPMSPPSSIKRMRFNFLRRHQSSSFSPEQIRMSNLQAKTNDESITTATVATLTPTTLTTTTTTASSGNRVSVEVHHGSAANNDVIATQPTGSSPFNSRNNLLNLLI